MNSYAHSWYWRLLALFLVCGLLFVAHSVSRGQVTEPAAANASGILLLKDGTVITTSAAGATLYYWKVNPIAAEVTSYSFEDGTTTRKTLRRERDQ